MTDKLQEVKQALEDIANETDPNLVMCLNDAKAYKIAINLTKQALDSLSSYIEARESEELKNKSDRFKIHEKVFIDIGNVKAYSDKEPLNRILTFDEIKGAAEAAIKAMEGGK